MTERDATRRAYNLAAAYGPQRAQELAEDSATRQAGTPSGDYWSQVADTIAEMHHADTTGGDDDELSPMLFI